MLTSLTATVAVGLLLTVAIAGALVGPTGELSRTALWALSWVGFPLVGLFIALRRPSTVIGWLLIGAGLAIGVGQMGWLLGSVGLDWGAPPPDDVGVFGYLGMYLNAFEPTGFVLLGLALLRFPGDRWSSTFGRWFGRALVITAVLTPIAFALRSSIGFEFVGREAVRYANPLALPLVADLADMVYGYLEMGFPLAVLAALNLIWRGIRSKGTERQQMKWLAFVAAAFLATIPPLVIAERLGAPAVLLGVIAIPVFVITFNGMAVAIGVAVLRYRLYDVDRVASRTATYAVLTATLAAVYAGAVVLLGGALRPLTGETGGDLVVAASTLAVAALFAPMRRRIQRLMDRRFNRSQVDAVRTVEAFSQRLRDEVDLKQIVDHLGEVTAETLEPVAAGVWIRGR